MFIINIFHQSKKFIKKNFFYFSIIFINCQKFSSNFSYNPYILSCNPNKQPQDCLLNIDINIIYLFTGYINNENKDLSLIFANNQKFRKIIKAIENEITNETYEKILNQLNCNQSFLHNMKTLLDGSYNTIVNCIKNNQDISNSYFVILFHFNILEIINTLLKQNLYQQNVYNQYFQKIIIEFNRLIDDHCKKLEMEFYNYKIQLISENPIFINNLITELMGKNILLNGILNVY